MEKYAAMLAPLMMPDTLKAPPFTMEEYICSEHKCPTRHNNQAQKV